MAEDPTAINGISILLFIGLAFAPPACETRGAIMPITPLHFGVLAPVNYLFPGKVSVVSFTLINL
jgi:hypothetical protein